MHIHPAAALLLSTAVPVLAPSARQDGKKWTQGELEKISREIQGDLEELRGERFNGPVTVRVSSKADLITYLKARQDKSDPPEKLAADEQIAKLLAVVDPKLDMQAQAQALLESQVGGFYDPDTKSFSLMESLPVGLTKITLSHELDHALDDQLFDIDGQLAKLGTDSDAQLAYQSVVEGSGTTVMTQWMLGHSGAIDLSEISEKEMKDLTSMAGAPLWMWKPLLGCYTVGAAFLQRSDNWMAGQLKPASPADIRAAFEHPPKSTEQVLHPAKYWSDESRDEPRKITFDTSKLESGWSALREDTLGEFLIGIICTPAREREGIDLSNPAVIMGIKFTNQISTGWGGDRLVLLGRDKARVLRWVTVWDTARDAGEFYGAMSQLASSFEASAHELAGPDDKDSAATVEYGDSDDEVIVTIRSGTPRKDASRVLKSLKHAE